MILPSVVIMLLLAGGQVEVRGPGNCPSREEISRALTPLLPGAGIDEPADLAELAPLATHADGSSEVQLRLLSPERTIIGERPLSLRGSCAERAEAVAAILAAWESEPVPGADVGAPSTGEELAQPASRPTASSPWWTSDRAGRSGFGTDARRDEARNTRGIQASHDAADGPKSARTAMRRLTPRAASWQLALGLEAGAALVGGLAGHGSIELRAGREASHWKMRIAFSGESARQLELLPGKVDWQHTSAGLSLAWHTLAPGWFLALDAGAVLGWASLAGHGYDSSAQQHSFEYGLSTGLRAGYQLGRWAFWLEGRPNFWLRGQRAVLTGESTTRDLPGTDMWLGAGLSAVLFP